MKGRLEIWLLSLGVLGLMVGTLLKLITVSYNLSGILSIAVYVFPLFLLLLLAVSRTWFGLGMGTVGLTFSIPLPVLSRLEIGMMLILSLSVVKVIESILKPRSQPLFRDMAPRLMMIVSAVVIGRFLYDRPGSANVGDLGGAGEAFAFLVACVAFFLMSTLGDSNWDIRTNRRVLTILLLIGFAVQCGISFYEGVWEGIVNLFSRQAWFLCPLVLASAFDSMRRSTKGFGMFRVLAFIGIVLILSALTPFRSRPVFAVCSVLCVAWIYGEIRKIILWLAIPFALLFFVVLWSEGKGIPYLMSRSVSIVLPVSNEKTESYIHEFGTSSETGWTSPFRMQLWTLAANEIRKNPFLGKGFAYSREELESAYVHSATLEDAVQGLALSGIYHNSLLELAVFCGIPAAIAFAAVFVLVLTRLVHIMPLVVDPAMRIVVSGTLGFLSSATGQFLMNGSGRDFFYVCVSLGALWGISTKLIREQGARGRQAIGAEAPATS